MKNSGRARLSISFISSKRNQAEQEGTGNSSVEAAALTVTASAGLTGGILERTINVVQLMEFSN